MPPLVELPSKHLLWVDDDGPERFPYEEHLLRERGWAVTWAASTAGAAKILAKESVDGIVTDIVHPLTENVGPGFWGGYHLIKWLRGERKGDWGDMKRIPPAIERYRPLDANKHLPILIASAFSDEKVHNRLRTLPRSAELSWLPKPLDDEKLLAFVETLELNRQAGGADSLIKSSLVFEEVEPAWEAIRRYLAQNPNFLHQMSPRKFELLVAEIFRDFGWEVELTSRTRDGGYDIIAVKRDWSSHLKLLVEAKRISPSRKVDVGIVRSLYGVKSTVAASQAILATSSYVSRDARREFSRVIPWELDFLERDKILDWCAQEDPTLIRSGGVMAKN